MKKDKRIKISGQSIFPVKSLYEKYLTYKKARYTTQEIRFIEFDVYSYIDANKSESNSFKQFFFFNFEYLRTIQREPNKYTRLLNKNAAAVL